MDENPTGPTGRAGPKPHNEPTQPNEVTGKPQGKEKTAGPRPEHEPTQPNEV